MQMRGPGEKSVLNIASRKLIHPLLLEKKMRGVYHFGVPGGKRQDPLRFSLLILVIQIHNLSTAHDSAQRQKQAKSASGCLVLFFYK
jgi:hypothetical protein